jgi:hypothetical protein
MSDNSTPLYFKEIKYAPDWLKKQRFNDELSQIEFSLNDEIFLFPDFDNIFSRSESAREWWFLSPEFKGKALHQGEEDINDWWSSFQGNYSSSILSRVEPRKFVELFFRIESDRLVKALCFDLMTRPKRTDVDYKDSLFSICYYYNFFHDLRIEKYWRSWLWQKMTVNYYHTLFAPVLNEKFDSRETLRLSNRFPEYTHAIDWLAMVRESLYGRYEKEDIDRFFNMQSIDRNNQVQATKKFFNSIEFAPISFCQCRVCGLIFCHPLKIAGDGTGKGGSKKICSATSCKKAWDLLRKSLPQNPEDTEGEMILLSHL